MNLAFSFLNKGVIHHRNCKNSKNLKVEGRLGMNEATNKKK